MIREIKISIYDDDRYVDGSISDDTMQALIEELWSIVDSKAYTYSIEETDI